MGLERRLEVDGMAEAQRLGFAWVGLGGFGLVVDSNVDVDVEMSM